MLCALLLLCQDCELSFVLVGRGMTKQLYVKHWACKLNEVCCVICAFKNGVTSYVTAKSALREASDIPGPKQFSFCFPGLAVVQILRNTRGVGYTAYCALQRSSFQSYS